MTKKQDEYVRYIRAIKSGSPMSVTLKFMLIEKFIDCVKKKSKEKS